MSEPLTGIEWCEEHECYHGGECVYCVDEAGDDEETLLTELDFDNDVVEDE